MMPSCLRVTVLGSLVVALLLTSSVVSAQSKEYEDTVHKFFDLLAAGKPTEAVDFLYKTNPYSDKITDSIQQVKSSLSSTSAMAGAYRTNVLILKKGLGDRLVYAYYLVAYDRQPFRFEFTFYRASDKWVLQEFAFSDKITDDLHDISKNELAHTLQ